MATLLNSINNQENDDENKNKPVTVNPGQQVATQPPAGSAAPQPSAQAPKPTGSGFVNLKNFLKANEGFKKEQGGLAGSIKAGLAKTGQEIKTGVESAAASQAGQATSQGVSATSAAGVDLSNPTALTPEQSAAFSGVQSATYTGPKTFTEADTTRAAQENLNKQLASTQDVSGRFGLLKNLVDPNKRYSRGAQRLDSLLLEGNKEQLGKLTDTSDITKNVDSARAAAKQSVESSAAKAESDIQAAKTAAAQKLGSAISRLKGQVFDPSRVQQAEKERQEATNKAIEAYASGTQGLNIGDTGLTPDQYREVVKQFYKPGSFNTSQAALGRRSTAELAQAQALQKLMGAGATNADLSALTATAEQQTKGSVDDAGLRQFLDQKQTQYRANKLAENMKKNLEAQKAAQQAQQQANYQKFLEYKNDPDRGDPNAQYDPGVSY